MEEVMYNINIILKSIFWGIVIIGSTLILVGAYRIWKG